MGALGAARITSAHGIPVSASSGDEAVGVGSARASVVVEGRAMLSVVGTLGS